MTNAKTDVMGMGYGGGSEGPGTPGDRRQNRAYEAATGPPNGRRRDADRTKILLLVIHPHQHTDKFARNLTVMLIQSLQISYQFDISGLEPGSAVAGLAMAGGVAVSATEAQPLGRNAQPVGDHA